MKLEQCAGGDRCQWNALVGRAEQQVEVDFRVFDSIGIKCGQGGEVGATIENTSSEKIRADATRFEGEFTEFQGAALRSRNLHVCDNSKLGDLHGLPRSPQPRIAATSHNLQPLPCRGRIPQLFP